ncbi:MAG: hypothetical protein COA79_15975 [Planctomycetota bacterium]|nr:MAG: hypothetical protein COA79_15975 [Planctomycetota bacterium]
MNFIRLILGTFGFGFLSFVILGYSFGDVDDKGIIFFLVGAIIGVFVGIACNKNTLPEKVQKRIAISSMLLGVSLILIIVWTLISGQDPITNEGMEGAGIMILFYLHVPAVLSCGAIGTLMLLKSKILSSTSTSVG